MKEFIRDPWKSMKHKNDWPKNFKKARSLVATQDDLHNIAHGLYQRNMSRIVEGHEILYDSQGVVLSGALFGVAKDKMLESRPLPGFAATHLELGAAQRSPEQDSWRQCQPTLLRPMEVNPGAERRRHLPQLKGHEGLLFPLPTAKRVVTILHD